MIDAYAVQDVRAAEQAAMAELPDGELMQRAAAGLARVAAERLTHRGGGRVVALVGAGDNGGDALYAAARLAAPQPGDTHPAPRPDDPHPTGGQAAESVCAVLVAEQAHSGGLAAARRAGVQVIATNGQPSTAAASAIAAADLVLDGLLGIGGRPGLSGLAAELVREVPSSAYLIAVDLPSGSDPAGEQRAAPVVHATETVTFSLAKPVHLLPPADQDVGRLTVVDIGVRPSGTPVARRLDAADVAARWPVPGPQDDKYSRGVLGVIAGGASYTGAPLMCVTAAVSTGAGMVRYVGPDAPTQLVRSQVPEAVIGDGGVQAWAIGSGMDPQADPDQRDAALGALGAGTPCVVDAGALGLLVEHDLPRSTPTLLTPHAGELARLLTQLGEKVERDQIEAEPLKHARLAATRTGCTVLLKGATTLVVGPDRAEPVRAQPDGPHWLATAGSGDVLAGICGALLAAGLGPLDVGSLATLVHGRAGYAANPGGPVRAMAVAHAIPGVVAELLCGQGGPA